ncbi:aspartate dehydrogenase domain-containing protein [Latimeria chalumnae]|nr:PREDICTED: putative L-aspartate dehydrogenase isoform X2 [Latimeria chalumnae]|eukprot:XP_014340532.1 PREDICTED: putative L-aspartate dehydrogenase isoform X2 [Latimeria chalumnae]
MIQRDGAQKGMELAFVWNRSVEKMVGNVPESLQLRDLSKIKERRADVIVEVAHPQLVRDHGEEFLNHAHFLVGSPSVFAEQEVETKLRQAAEDSGHTLYIPSGAFWGGKDIQKMADRGTLKSLKVTMTKHPSSFKLEGPLKELNKKAMDGRLVLYDGPVRGLCPLAPNNVNTMAAAAMAGHNLGFDCVQGCLVADPSIPDWHIVDIEVKGPSDEKSGHVFTVKTSRHNPATLGAVTGNATYASFWSSLLACKGHGGQVHLC